MMPASTLQVSHSVTTGHASFSSTQVCCALELFFLVWYSVVCFPFILVLYNKYPVISPVFTYLTCFAAVGSYLSLYALWACCCGFQYSGIFNFCFFFLLSLGLLVIHMCMNRLWASVSLRLPPWASTLPSLLLLRCIRSSPNQPRGGESESLQTTKR